MTLLDTRLRPVAKRLIASYGKAMRLRKVGEASYNASAGTSSLAETDYAITGVITQPSNMLIAQGLANSGDIIVMVAALDLVAAPENGDVLVIADPDGAETSWKILSVRSMFSGSEIATYECHARS